MRATELLQPSAWDRRRPGFTAVEMVIVVVLVGILISISLPGLNGMQRNKTAQNARDSFVWLAARARARAIETGVIQLLEIDPAAERVWIVRRGATLPTDTLLTVDYPTEFAATITTRTNTLITICYNPRGYAAACLGSSPTDTTRIVFEHAARRAMALVRPLGQVERM